MCKAETGCLNHQPRVASRTGYATLAFRILPAFRVKQHLPAYQDNPIESQTTKPVPLERLQQASESTWSAAWKLANEPLITLGERSISLLQIGVVVLTVVVGYLLVRWVERSVGTRLTKRNTNPDVVHLVRRSVLVIGLAILGITTLDLLSIPLTAFAFISGAIAIGVGFGAQNIINNFISGWILMWERPIRIGDFIEIDANTRGTIEAINTRSTRIRRVDGVHLLLPNSQLLENMVVNWTLVDRVTRTHVRVGVAYGSPTRKVGALIESVIKEREEVLENPAPTVLFDDFGDNALIFDGYFWIHATADRDLRIIRSELRHRIDEVFKEHDITIAFPQRDIHLDTPAPVEVRIVSESQSIDT